MARKANVKKFPQPTPGGALKPMTADLKLGLRSKQSSIMSKRLQIVELDKQIQAEQTEYAKAIDAAGQLVGADPAVHGFNGDTLEFEVKK